MDEPAGRLTEAEQRFEQWRQRSGWILAPIAFAGLWWVEVPGLNPAAHDLLAVFGLVVTLWITEALPLAVTALAGPALCVLLGIATDKEVLKSFGNPIIFLFLGSFVLAEAMFQHGLNRRIAFLILGQRWVARSPARILGAFGVVTGFLSMWISNTAATAMMFPIASAILSEMARCQSQAHGREVEFTHLKYGIGLMLTAAFASSIGGMATPVGTPPNLIGIGQIEKALGLRISFFEWMAFATPLAIVLIAFLVLYLNRACPAEAGLLGQSSAWIQEEKAKLGPLSRGEKNVLLAFGVTVALWLLPGVAALVGGSQGPTARWLTQRVPESVAALVGTVLLFMLPLDGRAGRFTLSWRQASRIDWGTILLFGGGLALGEAMFATGLANWIGEGLASRLGAHTALGLTLAFTGVAVLLTETTSNTATATMVVPVAIAVSQAAGVSPLQPALGACLGASLAFMLPVSTPPNAVVFGSGCVPLLQMVRHGLVLDLAAVAGVVATVHWLAPRVLP